MKKTFVTILAFVLVIALSIAGTVAYLTRTTNQVNNTFVAGQIGELDLKETANTHTGGKNTAGASQSAKTDKVQNEYLVIPGVGINKDPSVTFTPNGTNDVAVYVFVEVTGDWTANGKNYTLQVGSDNLTCTIGDDWTAVEGKSGVFYKALAAGDSLNAPVLKATTANGVTTTITVPATITAEQLNASNALKPLNFNAYAIQQDTFADAAAAWTAVKTASTSGSGT